MNLLTKILVTMCFFMQQKHTTIFEKDSQSQQLELKVRKTCSNKLTSWKQQARQGGDVKMELGHKQQIRYCQQQSSLKQSTRNANCSRKLTRATTVNSSHTDNQANKTKQKNASSLKRPRKTYSGAPEEENNCKPTAAHAGTVDLMHKLLSF